jgi:4-deoxy-L-threo-5-hexosulose-uronate ketol-isomerase
MALHYPPSLRDYRTLDTQGLRSGFLVESLFSRGQLNISCVDLDRVVLAGVIPLSAPIALPCPAELASHHFLERREAGIMNLGGSGKVQTATGTYTLAKNDCLYLGRGETGVVFSSDSPDAPAQFYLVSYLAHTAYHTTLLRAAEATVRELGTTAKGNRRRLCQYIHEKGIKSCQLVMGFTQLYEGSSWNTMPPHTHGRRSEVYLYYDIAEGQQVLHLMGEPQETRLLWVAEKKAVLSPPWSIHSGAGTEAYAFVWAMGGENQSFDDMDPAPVAQLR